jgi:hypothetical protein
MVFVISVSPNVTFHFFVLQWLMREVELQRRCDKNRKRSKRRAIYCPIHGCFIESVSQKYQLFAERPEQLQQRGMSRRSALMLISNQITVPLEGEWLEAFWCKYCQQEKWYHVHKCDAQTYKVVPVPEELWQQVTGVIDPNGNPSVGEFTRKQARLLTYKGIKNFKFVN